MIFICQSCGATRAPLPEDMNPEDLDADNLV